MTVHALILAGGEGSRLGGVRKAELRIGGQRLLDRVVSRLGGVRRPILVAGGEHHLDAGDCLALDDGALARQGPMAGLVAGLGHLLPGAQPDDVMVSVAVDTPFLPDDYVARMVGAVHAGAPAAYAAWRDNFYPVNSAWRLAALRDLPHRVLARNGPSSPRHLLADLGAVAVDWGAEAKEDPFINLNTLRDLLALGWRAGKTRE